MSVLDIGLWSDESVLGCLSMLSVFHWCDLLTFALCVYIDCCTYQSALSVNVSGMGLSVGLLLAEVVCFCSQFGGKISIFGKSVRC